MPILADQRKPTLKQDFSAQVGPTDTMARWWLADKDEAHWHIFSLCNGILLNLSTRRRMNYFFSILYNDIGAAFSSSKNLNLYYNQSAIDTSVFSNSRMTVNVLQNCIDTATSMIAKNKPKPQFLTDGAKDYGTKLKGKKLTKYVAALFDKMKFYQKFQRVFTDACIYGTGALKFYIDDGEICCERVFIEEILVDDIEGMNQTPTQIHQRKYVNRDILAEQFPKHKEAIYGAAQIASSGLATFSTADIIPVIESWHLPSGKKAGDGRHSIVIENATLINEPYDKDYFPILFFRWADQSMGFFGRGICHEIWKMQLELDTLYRMIQQSMRLVGGPVIALEAGSNIPEDHITSNKLAKVIEYTNVAPQFITPPIVQPEVYEHIDRIEDRMYKICGVSQAQATGNKPPDVKSGAAIREVADIAQGRFEIVGQRYEEFSLDAARMLTDLSNDIYEEDKAVSVFAKDKNGLSKLFFKDVKDALDECELELFPVSGLASTPAGKLDQLADYAAAGYMSKEQVMDIVDFPDLEDTVSLETASLHLTQEILSNIKEHGEKGWLDPNPFLNLPQSLQIASLEVDRAILQKVPEDHIDLLRDWCNAVQDLITQSQPPPQPQQPQGQPPPSNQPPQPQ